MHPTGHELTATVPLPAFSARRVGHGTQTESLSDPLTLPARAMSGRHRYALRGARAFCEALFSTAAGPPPHDRIQWLVAELDDLLCCAGWRSAAVYKTGLLLIAFIAPLFIGVPLPLWKLSLDQRVRALTRMEHSPIAAIVLVVKSIICIIHYEHPAALRDVGFFSHHPSAAASVTARVATVGVGVGVGAHP